MSSYNKKQVGEKQNKQLGTIYNEKQVEQLKI